MRGCSIFDVFPLLAIISSNWVILSCILESIRKYAEEAIEQNQKQGTTTTKQSVSADLNAKTGDTLYKQKDNTNQQNTQTNETKQSTKPQQPAIVTGKQIGRAHV